MEKSCCLDSKIIMARSKAPFTLSNNSYVIRNALHGYQLFFHHEWVQNFCIRPNCKKSLEKVIHLKLLSLSVKGPLRLLNDVSPHLRNDEGFTSHASRPRTVQF